jgi:putative spermidine/putrescine transport system substrate-binding protein
MIKAKRFLSSIRIIAVLVLTLLLGACGSSNSNQASGPVLPSHPVALEVADAGGYITQFGQAMIDAFAKANPNQVSKVTYLPRISPTSDLPKKLAAEESSGNVTTSIAWTGYDGLSMMIQQNLVEQLLPNYSDMYQSSIDNYVPSATLYQYFAQGYGVVVATTPSGPVFEYDPAKVPTPPKTIQELRDWIIAHPKQFLYAIPASSGPGRTFMMGLPYLLGDSNPQNPTSGWDKTWQFLKDIKSYSAPTASKTGDTLSALKNGTVSIIASTFGWDMNGKITNALDGSMKTFTLQGTKYVPDGAFVAMPKGLDKDTQIVVRNLIKYLLSPAAQVYTYAKGYFYPGPAIKEVPLTDAPQDIQGPVNQYLSPDYANWIASIPVVRPLVPDDLVTAFNKWNSDIGQ